MAQKKIKLAIAGATGAVGNQMIQCLEEADFPVNSVQLLASSRSVGRQLRFKGELLDVKELKEDSFKGVDIALFSAGGGTSEKFAPYAALSSTPVPLRSRTEIQIIHRDQYAALGRLEPIPYIGQCATDDHAHRVRQIAFLQLLFDWKLLE